MRALLGAETADVEVERGAAQEGAREERGVKPDYQREGVTLYHGDARELLPKLEDASIDFIFTDPPYGHNNNNNGDLAHRREEALGHVKRGIAKAGEARPIANDGPEANELVRGAFDEFDRLLRAGCCCCCCCGGGGPDPQFARWSLWLDEAVGFKHAVVWDKGGLGMGWHYRRNYEMVLVGQKRGGTCRWFGGNDVGNVIRISGIKPSADDHPTPKPVLLPALFLNLHTQQGDIVLDPFMGHGTTGIACIRARRRFVGIEIDPKHFDAAVKRIDAELDQPLLAIPTDQKANLKQEEML